MRHDTHSMLYTKHFVFDPPRLAGKRLLHGHVPTPVAKVQAAVVLSALMRAASSATTLSYGISLPSIWTRGSFTWWRTGRSPTP